MISIRRATQEEWEIIQKLNNEVFVDNAVYDHYLDRTWPFSPQGIEHYKKVVSSPNYCTYVAFEGDIPVGHIVGGQKVINFRAVKTAEIIEIGVSPEYRSKGVGAKLIEMLKQWCKENGYQTLMVNSYSTNKKAIAFYKKQGMTPIDIDLEMIL